MTNNELLIDAYLYFAKFPLLAGVQASFTKNAGKSEISGYDEFKTKVDALSENSLIPGIKNFVFGVDVNRVTKRIESFSGFYLMVDYGQIQSPPDRNNVVTDSFFIAVTIARPFKDEDMDDAEEILLTQQAYTYLMEIKEKMRLEERNSLTRHLLVAADADPFNSTELNNSVGWTLLMQRTGVLQL